MANRLEMYANLDASGFAKGVREMEVLSLKAGSRISGALSGTTAGYSTAAGSLTGHGGRGGVIGEMVVLFRELGRGNYSRIPGSITILAQRMGVLKFLVADTAAAAVAHAAALGEEATKAEQLAAKLNNQAKAAVAYRETAAAVTAEELKSIKALEAQAGAAAKNALALRGDAAAAQQDAAAQEELAAARGFTLSTTGWVIIAVVALAVATYALVHHLRTLAREEKNLADLTDLTSRSFEDQAKHIKTAAELHQSEIDRLNELATSQKGVKDAIDQKLKSMREEASLQRELASAQGISKVEMARMEIEAEKKELDYLKQQNEELEKKVENDRHLETLAASRKEDFTLGGGSEQANKKAEDAAKLIDAIREAMKTATFGTGQHEAMASHGGGFGYGPEIMRAANETDILKVKVGEKEYLTSLKTAIEAYEYDAAVARELARVEKEISDTLRDKQKLTDEDVARLNRLKGEQSDLEQKLGLSGLREQVAAAQDAKGNRRQLPSDSLIRSGNFLGSTKGQIESLAEKQYHVAKEHLQVSKQILHTLSTRGGGRGGSTHPGMLGGG